MAEVWKKTLELLKKDSGFGAMFHMMEQYGDHIAAEMTDKEGNELQRTYREAVSLSCAACGNLQRKNIGVEGAVIGLSYETCMDWPVLMWGILMSGYIPLFLNPASDVKLNIQILAEAGAAGYVAEKPMQGCGLPFISAADLLKPGKPGTEKWGQYVALCTSGTTGASRIFLYDGQTIANHILSFDEAKKMNPDMPFIENEPCKLLAFLPFHHVFGFSVVYLLYSCTGKTLVYLPEKSVNAILGACQKHGVTHLYCIPMFFNALAAGITRKLGNRDIHKLPWIVRRMIRRKTLGTQIRSMITGGGHIPESTLDILNSIGYPLCNGFGMTETGIISVERSLDAEQRKKGSIGVPFTLTEWKIDAPDGEAGEFFIRGGALYAASMIQGEIVPRDREAWFATGDLVAKKADGLYIMGRLKDVIIGASGENIYPEELEDVFAGINGVTSFCMTGISAGAYETISLVMEAPGNREEICEEIRRRSLELPAAERPSRVYFSREKLPVSGNMKVKRQLVKKEIEAGTWPCEGLELYQTGAVSGGLLDQNMSVQFKEEYESTEEYREILRTVKALTAESLHIEPETVGDNDHFIMVLGGDSLTVLSILSELEKKYGLVMTDAEMMQMENCSLTAKKIYCKLHGIAEADGRQTEEQPTHRITDFSESEEYRFFCQRLKDTFPNGENPYFVPHDSLILDTSVIGGREVINLGSYNYLGMSGNPETEQAAIDAIRKYGTSASGSRTLAGEKTLFRQLEKTIADWKHTEDAIACTGGWATNLAFVSCFARKGDFIVYDKLSHNSLSEGVKLSEADSRAFEHNNLEQLEEILKMVKGRYNKVLIIVEGVYSMDGDVAPIPKFVELKKKYNCFLMVDEAHSGGVLGEHAGGVDDYFHLAPHDIDIKYGTMSKALGTCGGFIAADHSIVEYLRYNMNGFVFTAGIAPPLAAACMKAIEIIQRDNTAVSALHRNIAYFVRRAKEEGMNICLAGESAIVPVLIGSDADAARLSAQLTARGVFVPPAMYPAVPKGQSRLRFTISATHSIEQLEKAITETAAVMREGGFLQ